MPEIIKVPEDFIPGKFISGLDGAIQLIGDVADFYEEWVAPLQSSGLNTEQFVQRTLSSAVVDEQIAKLLDALPLENLKALQARATARVQAILADPIVKALLAPVSSSEPQVLEGSFGPVAGDVGGIRIEGGISCDPAAAWSFPSDEVAGPLFKIELKGGIDATAKVALPLNVGLRAGASAQAYVDYFWRVADRSRPVVMLLPGLVRDLGLPFAYHALWQRFHSTEAEALEGIILNISGSTAIAVDLTVGHSLELSSIGALDLGLKVSAGITATRSYALSLRRTEDHRIRLTLSRKKDDGTAAGFDLGIKLNATALAQRVEQILTKAFTWVDTKLAVLEPYLSPGTLIKAKLPGEIAALLAPLMKDKDSLQAALADDLSGMFSGENNRFAALQTWIEDWAAHKTMLWEGDATQTKEQLVAAVQAELPPMLAELLRSAIATGSDTIDTAITAIGDGFNRELKATITGITDRLPLADLLNGIGAGVAKAEADLDKLTAGVRDLVTRYRKLRDTISTGLQQEARRKLQIDLGVGWQGGSGYEIDVAGIFAEDSPEAEAIFRSLVAGDLTVVQRLFDVPLGQKTPFELDRELSSIGRFARSQLKTSYNFLIVGFGAEGWDLLKADAEIIAHGDGSLSVGAKGSFTKGSKGKESRELAFVSSYALQIARAAADKGITGRKLAQIGVSATQQDPDLTAKDIRAFLSTLEACRLIDGTIAPKLLGAVATWIAKAGGDNPVPADLSVQMSIDGNALANLMRLSRRTGKILHETARIELFDIAIDALRDTNALKERYYHDGIAYFARQDGKATTGDRRDNQFLRSRTAAQMRTAFANASANHSGSHSTVAAANFDWANAFIESIDAACGLRDIADIMGVIYAADPKTGPQSTGWTADDYRSAEFDLVKASRPWLMFKTKWWLFTQDEIHPRMAALFLAVYRASLGLDADRVMDLYPPPGTLGISLSHRANGETIAF